MQREDAFCWWCHAPIKKMQKGYNEKKHKPMCSRGCRDAETLFNILFSDEAINQRAHYRALTENGGNLAPKKAKD